MGHPQGGNVLVRIMGSWAHRRLRNRSPCGATPVEPSPTGSVHRVPSNTTISRPFQTAQPRQPQTGAVGIGLHETVVGNSSASDQVRAGVVYRGCEVETLAGKGERVDPEYLSVAINQRATGVPWVHCGVSGSKIRSPVMPPLSRTRG
jgi:hypothetical protein